MRKHITVTVLLTAFLALPCLSWGQADQGGANSQLNTNYRHDDSQSTSLMINDNLDYTMHTSSRCS